MAGLSDLNEPRNMKLIKTFAVISALILAAGCVKTEAGKTDLDMKEKIRLISPSDGQTEIETTNRLVRRFVSENYTLKCCDKYFDLVSDKYAPQEIEFRWEGRGKYIFYLSENKDFTDPYTVACDACSLSLGGLKTGTEYFWKVSGDVCESEIFSFTTAHGPRTVYIDGVTNSRDIGGWDGINGGIRQGRVFRTAYLDKITDEGIRYCREFLKIRTELDLRADDEGNRKTLGHDVSYINISSAYYAGDHSIYDRENYEATNRILEIFADKDNYPILVHCTVGRDRTGTIAFLLEALCGMSEDDIYREYDLSFFSANGDHEPSLMHKNFFNQLYVGLYRYVQGGALSDNARRYCLDIGLTERQIDAIIANLTE